ncbi:MAG: type I DNA topoisomerase [Firmicutes bacterium]|nr:type I DNA topoisomerase [Bacillota bacterium]
MKTLIIVESPTKAKTIENMLGKSYVVRPCVGHVRDLPKSTMGVDIEHDFAPHYITIRGKGEVIKVLKDEAKKADQILLASDPDREGEAIAWHLQQYLRINNEQCRIRFNEITKTAIQNAVEHPQPIDMNKVEAQQARRILDRLVGYQISPLLWKKVKKGLSAGRVQSVAVRLICDREKEIHDFVPQEYWILYAVLQSDKGNLVVKLAKIDNKKAKLPDEEAVEELKRRLAGETYRVSSVSKKDRTRHPLPPFTTSMMQQEASRRLSMRAKKTMQTAQQLYEGIQVDGVVTGLITYMRTDSTRVSDEARQHARDYVRERYGEKFLPAKPRAYNSKKGTVQDAHEAIRPTSVQRTPQALKPFLSATQYKLYKLIWERFVASQMADAIYEVTTIEVTAGGCLFKASGSIAKFPGYTQVYNDGKEEQEQEDLSKVVPVNEGDVLPLERLDASQHFTQPPPRFSEASLIKTMEELGIGRPSTYAPIIDTILSRYYVVREEKQLYPTELGFLVVDLIKEYFGDIIDVEFTATMESNLDRIEEGEANWVQILRDFYDPFAVTLAHAEQEMEKVVIEPEVSDQVCEKCGKPMVYRMGRYGRFLACSGFPECRNTKAIIVPTNVKCLACGGDIVERKSRSGRIFYGCANYPECRYVAWDMPIEEKCPHCGTQLTAKTTKTGKEMILCPNMDCPSRAGQKRKTRSASSKSTKSKSAAPAKPSKKK